MIATGLTVACSASLLATSMASSDWASMELADQYDHAITCYGANFYHEVTTQSPQLGGSSLDWSYVAIELGKQSGKSIEEIMGDHDLSFGRAGVSVYSISDEYDRDAIEKLSADFKECKNLWGQRVAQKDAKS